MSVLQEQESSSTAALRAELEQELRNKRQCSNQSYECTQLCLENYKFCPKHILQDKNAPFKQCSYVFSSNGKRCHLPAPKSEKKEFGFCNEHALRATLQRNKQNSKNQPPRTAEVLLHSLSHYVRKPKGHTSSASYSDDEKVISSDGKEQKITKHYDAFDDLDANSILTERANKVLDYNSESESDVEPSTLSTVWHDAQADSSSDESVDSEYEDPLKHAGVYTAEEVTSIIRDKLIRLQSLYVEQYRHLQYLLKEKRRKYIHALKREKETCCNIHSQVRDNPKEQRMYKKLKYLNNYQKCFGVDAILSKRVKDIRAKSNEAVPPKAHFSTKCIFTEGGVKCGERILPLTKYCKKHILEDPYQVLFRACGRVNGDMECHTPIAAIFDDSTCELHMDIPLLKSYNQVRKDSESDMDDSRETANNQTEYHTDVDDNFSHNIKHEFVPYDIPPELPKMETLPTMLFEENSQSMSESTVSQNDIFNINDPQFFDIKQEENSETAFSQVDQSQSPTSSTSVVQSTKAPFPDYTDIPSTSKQSDLIDSPMTDYQNRMNVSESSQCQPNDVPGTSHQIPDLTSEGASDPNETTGTSQMPVLDAVSATISKGTSDSCISNEVDGQEIPQMPDLERMAIPGSSGLNKPVCCEPVAGPSGINFKKRNSPDNSFQNLGVDINKESLNSSSDFSELYLTPDDIEIEETFKENDECGMKGKEVVEEEKTEIIEEPRVSEVAEMEICDDEIVIESQVKAVREEIVDKEVSPDKVSDCSQSNHTKD